ncbi:MAG: peptide ABC transporter ATP-binding protein [Candidatus Marinimicrobia bacterium]|nr:peptide ABC transporter ATP-binding protein [Candidatus Neomarinimicrobiota bacterium]|tara:strand:+ start:11283 stop:12281 length:999 start_codon:yes stop_codon:yes gene_type:complete
MSKKPIIEVKNLKTYFKTDAGVAHAVEDVSFDVYPGETLGIVGESGCGKSVTALSIMRLVAQPPGYYAGGEILFNGESILDMPKNKIQKIRGNKISMIFQEPMTSLNPVFTCGDQIMESIILHQKLSEKEAKEKAIEMLKLVGIPSPERRVEEYPHQLSGGMRQRVMIAMALSCNPSVLIADEPTTALDVTIQAQILELIEKLQKEMGLAVMMITHDLGVIAEICDRVIVMYAGQIQEIATVHELFNNPLHPYTQALMESIPKINQEVDKLKTLPGMVPSLLELGDGCRFCNRFNDDECPCAGTKENQELIEFKKGHYVRCNKKILKKQVNK